MYHPTRGGVRGGKDQFTWESVKTDKDRECYLGHSLKAPVGRWQEGKDLTWYAKEGNGTDSKTISEFQKAKELEEQALMAALGYRVVKKQPSTSDHQAQQASSSSTDGGSEQKSKTNRPSIKGPSLIQLDDKKSIDELLLKLLVKHNINELVQALGGDKDSLKKSKKKKTKKHKSKSSKHDSESSSSSSSSESSSESDNDHRKHPTKSKKRKSSPSSTIDSSKKSSHDASKSAKKHKHSSKRSKSSSDDSENNFFNRINKKQIRMTYFHFINCIGLSCAPYFITYKYAGLAEYSVFWKYIQTGLLYLFVQFCKMLILATFFPAFDDSKFDVFVEFLKITVDLGDLIGLHIAMTKIAGKCEIKYLIAGVGWASAELIMTKFFPLWTGARGVEFDWKYILMSLDSNISLAQHIATALLVYLYNRNDTSKHAKPILFLIILCCYRPLLSEILVHGIGLGSWSLILCKALFTSMIGLIGLSIFNNVSSHLSNTYFSSNRY